MALLYLLNLLTRIKKKRYVGTCISLHRSQTALTNFTENYSKTVEELSCSAEFFRGLRAFFLSALNIFLSITAFLGNTLILVALRKETSLHAPSKLLYLNLAITELCVGIIADPLAVTYWTSVVKERRDICYYAYLAENLSGHTLCSVSLLTLTAISVDRPLALLLGLRYRHVLTLKRTCINAFGFGILSMVGSSSYSLIIKPKIALRQFNISERID